MLGLTSDSSQIMGAETVPEKAMLPGNARLMLPYHDTNLVFIHLITLDE